MLHFHCGELFGNQGKSVGDSGVFYISRWSELFLHLKPNPFEASIHAMKAMGIAGERAAAISRGNGSMMVNFLDELCNLGCHE